MTWTVAHPILFFLPLGLCLVIHVFLSAGFLLSTRQGFFRFLIYLISCLYVLGYLLIFNHGLTLTSTKIQLDFTGRYIKYENQYGILRIPAESVQGVIVEGMGTTPATIWVQSERQTFYLDRKFQRFEQFFPLLQSMIPLSPPQAEGEATIYRGVNYAGPLNLNYDNNVLRGRVTYFLPWLVIFSITAYFLAGRAWLGNFRIFQMLAALYSIPMVILGIIYKPTLPVTLFLVLYPLYPIFLSAMCLPDSANKVLP